MCFILSLLLLLYCSYSFPQRLTLLLVLWLDERNKSTANSPAVSPLGRKLWLWLFSLFFFVAQKRNQEGGGIVFLLSGFLIGSLTLFYIYPPSSSSIWQVRKKKKKRSERAPVHFPLIYLAPRYLVTLCPFSHSHARLSIWPVKRIQCAETHETLWPAVDFDLLFLSRSLSLHLQKLERWRCCYTFRWIKGKGRTCILTDRR
jgi:hypothetical protein